MLKQNYVNSIVCFAYTRVWLSTLNVKFSVQLEKLNYHIHVFTISSKCQLIPSHVTQFLKISSFMQNHTHTYKHIRDCLYYACSHKTDN